ncbi:leucyl/phenylalanyl-tRNA--protein transferase [Deinococcus fonticola]|uniref:leucyl/phenylalanyl-tRNA--protein transferase n=1 Tax=Deinococcus fonticola TaxID=2528713 RepID=UPI001074D842|nr:leucyl/phenylalanyl-tRNA--protein transferase [Deinococcus fonticola]
MPSAAFFLNHPDPFTREVARMYAQGAFLMDNGDGVRFYSVENRALVPLTAEDGLHVPRRLKRDLKHFEPRVNTAFLDVVRGCRGTLPGSPPRDGEWISDELSAIYAHLHTTGLSHSFEVWRGGELAGGVLGIALGGIFFAESKFHRVTNASKAALIHLAGHLRRQGFSVLDAQIQNSHIATLGVYEISQAEFQSLFRAALPQEATF